MGGLDQYDAECFGKLIFATIRESVRLKGIKIIGVYFGRATQWLSVTLIMRRLRSLLTRQLKCHIRSTVCRES